MNTEAELASRIIRDMTTLLAAQLRGAAVEVAKCPHVSAAQALNDCALGLEHAVPDMLRYYKAMVEAQSVRKN